VEQNLHLTFFKFFESPLLPNSFSRLYKTTLGFLACVLLLGCQTQGRSSLANSFVPLVVLTESYEVEPNTSFDEINSINDLAAVNRLDYLPISDAALETSELNSAEKLTVEEQKLSLSSLKWEALPSLVPSVSLGRSVVDNEGIDGLSYRLGLQQSLFDFGKHASRIEQTSSEITQSKIQHWIERNEAVEEALTIYIEFSLQQRFLTLSNQYVQLHEELYSVIQKRFRGGVSDRSELSLIDIRLNELQLDKESDQRASEAAQEELAYLTNLDLATINEFPELSNKFERMKYRNVDLTPEIANSISELFIAKARRKETLGTSLPDLILEAYTEGDDDGNFQGIEVRFETSAFAGFAYRSHVKQADAAIKTANARVNTAKRDFERHYKQLLKDQDNLMGIEGSLIEQLDHSNQSVNLFFKQFNSGVKPIVDAIRVYESTFNTARKLAQVRADLHLNQVAIGKLIGTLAPHPDL